uniref:Uncharacterized protein n=1 Tax=Panagrolaimus davidi TaxID=227884 RepID=A0A914Q6V0_9BILA
MQLVLKTQFEAMSRYEHVNEKKLMEHIIDSFTLGRVKGKTDIEFDICHLKVPENAVPSQHSSRNEIEPNIIILSYVLRLSATPGIETEIPLLITSNGYRNTIKHGSVEEVTAAMNEIKPPIKGKPRLSIVEGNMNSRRVSYYC